MLRAILDWLTGKQLAPASAATATSSLANVTAATPMPAPTLTPSSADALKSAPATPEPNAPMFSDIAGDARGIRNNNPCNIRISSTPWEGKISPNTDGAFEQFRSAKDGIRAGAKLLCNYYRLHGLQTVTQIISRFAPSNENNTNAYIDAVAHGMGVGDNSFIDLLSSPVLGQLVSAIIKHENGIQPYTWELIEDACQDAITSFAPAPQA